MCTKCPALKQYLAYGEGRGEWGVNMPRKRLSGQLSNYFAGWQVLVILVIYCHKTSPRFTGLERSSLSHCFCGSGILGGSAQPGGSRGCRLDVSWGCILEGLSVVGGCILGPCLVDLSALVLLKPLSVSVSFPLW